MGKLGKNFIIVVLILLGVSALFALFAEPFKDVERVTLTELVEGINKEEIDKIEVSGNKLKIFYNDGAVKESTKEAQAALSETLANYGVDKEKFTKVNIEQKEPSGFMAFIGPLSFLLFPILLFAVFFFFIFFRTGSTCFRAEATSPCPASW